ncbi:MAG TPA: response regulator [Candidatus Methylomirabilis sp.]|nr:response regulator [Candidatus Methylomirabilis sp.]HSC71364.1 response regulator [Candidatus Methylomirabilis sp.]
MEERHASEFCPRCQSVQRTLQFTEDAHLVRRCQVCGFPLEGGLVLEGGESAGLPSPSEVKILCVDDDPLILQLIGDILRFQGYTVLTARDGPSGLEAATRERPSLVLLDVMMPGLDGFEVCRRLKADPDLMAIPVIILTAMADPALRSRASEAGAKMVLQKPAPTATVLRTIEAALVRPRSGEPALGLTEAGMTRQPGTQPDLSVPTRPTPLTVWTADGATLQARISLRLVAEGHAGPETVQDRLNEPDRFLALSVAADPPVVFLNKIQVVRVDVAEDVPEADAEERSIGVSLERITVQLVNGEQFTGSVGIEGPDGRRRLSDFLNAQPAFLPLHGTDRLHLLHKRFVARIVPQRS